jgi:hypothetical protein
MCASKTMMMTGLAAFLAGSTAIAATDNAYDAPVDFDLTFIFHIDQDLAEQDVYVERVPGSGEVYRPTKGERDMSQQLYAAKTEVPHMPFDPDGIGPWPMGEPLGMTLGEWFQAKGEGAYSCRDGEGYLTVDFTGLVPNGVYTMWHYFMAWPPAEPFTGTYDLPVGSRDGEQSVFTADADGNAVYQQSFKPCLQLTGEHLASGLALNWHSDGKTYGVLPGPSGSDAHIQLYVDLPKRNGI